ncbi:MAG: hydantoinase/oxoprolinase family protein [Halarchaeum sp.]
MTSEGVRVGVDVGGTFTDVVTLRDGEVRVTKTPSTPASPEDGVVNGLAESAAAGGFAPAEVGFLGHGTTVATNAVLEGTWAETALVTTEGFRDVLEIGRQDRPDIYDFGAEKPDPIVPRDRRFGVPERLDERGRAVREIDEDAVRAVAERIRESGAESVAVSLLFAFEDDAHERRVAELLRESGVEASLSLSSDVFPEIREYERTLTTALNAALKPVMDEYVGELTARVRERGVGADLRVMQSNGGLITADAARSRPVNTLLSGPAAGVRGATYVAGRRGVEDVVTMDMGGTSCDVSLVRGGDPLVSTDVEVGDYAVGVPSVDVHTVGAGGGSIAWVDDGGALRVGPRSAGADPGPVCYGRGGTRPTTTDAHFLLGRIDPSGFIDSDLDGIESDVRAAFEGLCDELGMAPEAAAQGVLDVANANMARALRVVSVERGHDPREFTLVAFGGAGPLHAPRLAGELDMPEVVVPNAAGVLSALGLLVSDVVYDDSVSRVRPWEGLAPATVAGAFESMREDGAARLAAEGVPESRRVFERTADLRYAGQSFDLSVPVPEDVDDEALESVVERFHERHERRYGHADRGEPVELVTLRLRARGVVETPDLSPAAREGSVADARRGARAVTYDGEVCETAVYERSRLPVGATVAGPAVVEGAESTVVVHPDQSADVDADGNLVVATGGGR